MEVLEVSSPTEHEDTSTLCNNRIINQKNGSIHVKYVAACTSACSVLFCCPYMVLSKESADASLKPTFFKVDGMRLDLFLFMIARLFLDLKKIRVIINPNHNN